MQPSASKRPVVLIVEDETLIRIEAIEAIEAAGFDVVEAADADQAIAILEQRGDIRLIFTDIHMPGSMDGLKACAFRQTPAGRRSRSLQTFQVMRKIKKGDLPEGSHLVAKPYAVAEIASVIGQLIRQ